MDLRLIYTGKTMSYVFFLFLYLDIKNVFNENLFRIVSLRYKFVTELVNKISYEFTNNQNTKLVNLAGCAMLFLKIMIGINQLNSVEETKASNIENMNQEKTL